jgi:hypothetical protein
MLKAIAVLRSLFLIFIVVYTLRGMPIWGITRTFDEQYARCSASLGAITGAVWIAIGWIAFETAVGWWLAARQARRGAAATPPAKPAGA